MLTATTTSSDSADLGQRVWKTARVGHRATTSTLRAAGAQLLSAGLLEVLLAAAVFLLSRLER
ncbi:MAG: hypothetical protein VB093_19150, partial [Propionicimonas sp.]|nr:hypothetical protein [Propionicimonas sp.]